MELRLCRDFEDHTCQTGPKHPSSSPLLRLLPTELLLDCSSFFDLFFFREIRYLATSSKKLLGGGHRY